MKLNICGFVQRAIVKWLLFFFFFLVHLPPQLFSNSKVVLKKTWGDEVDSIVVVLCAVLSFIELCGQD